MLAFGFLMKFRYICSKLQAIGCWLHSFIHTNAIFMKTLTFIFLFCYYFSCFVQAQVIVNEATTEVVKATEFSIPSSPAFIMLDASPDRITKPGLPRNFKVDWSLKSYSLSPNLALEAQPIWLLFFDRSPLSKYQKANGLVKMFSTISLSAGTVQRDTINWLAIAGKMNIYRSRDPLTDRELLDSLNMVVGQDEELMQQQLETLKKQNSKLKSKKDAESIKMQTQLNKSIDSLKIELINKQTLRKQTVRDLQQRYVRRHWNTSYLDVAYGKSYKYDKDSKLDSLVLLSERNSLWVSGSLGLGKNWLLSDMAQYNLTATSDNYMVGTNLRYSSGNNNYNFFAELFREGYSQTPDLNTFTIAYGGDFKLGRNILLSYAIRTVYTDKLHFKDVAPIANVICLMR